MINEMENKRNNEAIDWGTGNMKEIDSFDEFLEILKETEYFLVYFSTNGCAVCVDSLPRVIKLIDEIYFPAFHIKADKLSQARGQLSVFTAPTVIIYFKGKEYHRESRFINYGRLEKRMREIKEIEKQYWSGRKERKKRD